jgi:hypothetical protein
VCLPCELQAVFAQLAQTPGSQYAALVRLAMLRARQGRFRVPAVPRPAQWGHVAGPSRNWEAAVGNSRAKLFVTL